MDAILSMLPNWSTDTAMMLPIVFIAALLILAVFRRKEPKRMSASQAYNQSRLEAADAVFKGLHKKARQGKITPAQQRYWTFVIGAALELGDVWPGAYSSKYPRNKTKMHPWRIAKIKKQMRHRIHLLKISKLNPLRKGRIPGPLPGAPLEPIIEPGPATKTLVLRKAS